MNITVCFSSVPDTTSKINFVENGKKFDTTGIQYVINPYDEFGLTKAIFLKEKNGGKKILRRFFHVFGRDVNQIFLFYDFLLFR